MCSDSLGDCGGCTTIRVGAKNNEFLAAVSGDRIARPQAVLDDAGDVAQNVVSSLVAMGVVNALEVVDVDEHRGQIGSVSTRLLSLDHTSMLKVASIVDACQRIRQPDSLQSLVGQRAVDTDGYDSRKALQKCRSLVARVALRVDAPEVKTSD
jgi:hypothetical protein